MVEGQERFPTNFLGRPRRSEGAENSPTKDIPHLRVRRQPKGAINEPSLHRWRANPDLHLRGARPVRPSQY